MTRTKSFKKKPGTRLDKGETTDLQHVRKVHSGCWKTDGSLDYDLFLHVSCSRNCHSTFSNSRVGLQ